MRVKHRQSIARLHWSRVVISALIDRQLASHKVRKSHICFGLRVLLDTFVETPRHRGTCYKAANWIHVGQTVGRGKKSTVHHQIIPIKDIWLYPLRKNFRSVLAQ